MSRSYDRGMLAIAIALNIIEARLPALTVFSPDGHLFQVFLSIVLSRSIAILT